MSEDFYRIHEVANILKVCPRTVLNMIKQGKFKVIEISGVKRKTYRILKGELDRYIAEEYEKSKKG